MPCVLLYIFILVPLFRVSSIIFMYFRMLLLFMVLDSSLVSILSHIDSIMILLHFLIRSFVIVENFLLFFLGAYSPTSSANSKTTSVRLSFKPTIYPFISSVSCDYFNKGCSFIILFQ